ncbi:hypothetical protein XELAEV_18040412mg [Xenopus laevis]|uniref:Uncharacterized protein n=1 Tax=Xenopus laevis TaxID=8355 RepID=A0A974C9M1_XENLA|nr:hypothetical protein XELAEV_18040412mg [Xenopus laevis]
MATSLPWPNTNIVTAINSMISTIHLGKLFAYREGNQLAVSSTTMNTNRCQLMSVGKALSGPQSVDSSKCEKGCYKKP